MNEITISKNRKAHFEYFISDVIDAGMVLFGSEVKSLRNHHVNIEEAHVEIKDGECWLVNASIERYEEARDNHIVKRTRKLLITKSEIKSFNRKTSQKGFTIIPLRIFFNDTGRVKLEIGLAKGKHTYDKKATKKAQDIQRTDQKEMKINSY